MIYLDMDGVCCDWVGPAAKLIGHDPAKLYASWPAGCTTLHDAVGGKSSDYWSKINANPQWWVNLPEYPWFRELYLGLSTIDTVLFLSSPGFSADACRGKVLWLQSRLGSNFKGFILTSHKQFLSARGAVLIDDHVENVHAFAEYSYGRAVLFPRLWNGRRDAAVYGSPDHPDSKTDDIVSLVTALLAKYPGV